MRAARAGARGRGEEGRGDLAAAPDLEGAEVRSPFDDAVEARALVAGAGHGPRDALAGHVPTDGRRGGLRALERVPRRAGEPLVLVPEPHGSGRELPRGPDMPSTSNRATCVGSASGSVGRPR